MPLGRKAPKLMPPEPVQSTVSISSGRPSAWRAVTSEPSIVPTQRFTFAMSAWKRWAVSASRAARV